MHTDSRQGCECIRCSSWPRLETQKLQLRSFQARTISKDLGVKFCSDTISCPELVIPFCAWIFSLGEGSNAFRSVTFSPFELPDTLCAGSRSVAELAARFRPGPPELLGLGRTVLVGRLQQLSGCHTDLVVGFQLFENACTVLVERFHKLRRVQPYLVRRKSNARTRAQRFAVALSRLVLVDRDATVQPSIFLLHFCNV